MKGIDGTVVDLFQTEGKVLIQSLIRRRSHRTLQQKRGFRNEVKTKDGYRSAPAFLYE